MVSLAEHVYTELERRAVSTLAHDFLGVGFLFSDLAHMLRRYGTVEEVAAALVVLETLGRVEFTNDDCVRLR